MACIVKVEHFRPVQPTDVLVLLWFRDGDREWFSRERVRYTR